MRDSVGSPWGICDQQAAEAYCKTAGQQCVRTEDCRITMRPTSLAKAYWMVDNRQRSGACIHVGTLTLSSMFCKSIPSDGAVKTSYVRQHIQCRRLCIAVLDAIVRRLCGRACWPAKSAAACERRAISKLSAKCTGAQRGMASQNLAARKRIAQTRSALQACAGCCW